MQDIEQTIRERAYRLWLDSGCQDGHADAHWLTAERETLARSLGELSRVAVAPRKANKSKAHRKKQRAA